MNLHERTVKLLRGIEYGGPFDTCPYCSVYSNKMHASNCQLAALLSEHEKAAQPERMSTGQEAAYKMIDQYLRNNLGDNDYREYQEALDVVLGEKLSPTLSESHLDDDSGEGPFALYDAVLDARKRAQPEAKEVQAEPVAGDTKQPKYNYCEKHGVWPCAECGTSHYKGCNCDICVPKPVYDPQAQQATESTSFQNRVDPWLQKCFCKVIAADTVERNHRFIEEALELVQACGMPKTDAHSLVEYVYGRPCGELSQEVGGVMVTLAALCIARGTDMHADAEKELARIWTKVDVIRAKQAAKPRGSALPEAPRHAQQVKQLRELVAKVLESYPSFEWDDDGRAHCACCGAIGEADKAWEHKADCPRAELESAIAVMEGEA
jgi:hypothetical protein